MPTVPPETVETGPAPDKTDDQEQKNKEEQDIVTAPVASIDNSTARENSRRTTGLTRIGVNVLSLKRQITNAIKKQNTRKHSGKDRRRSRSKRKEVKKDDT